MRPSVTKDASLRDAVNFCMRFLIVYWAGVEKTPRRISKNTGIKNRSVASNTTHADAGDMWKR